MSGLSLGAGLGISNGRTSLGGGVAAPVNNSAAVISATSPNYIGSTVNRSSAGSWTGATSVTQEWVYLQNGATFLSTSNSTNSEVIHPKGSGLLRTLVLRETATGPGGVTVQDSNAITPFFEASVNAGLWVFDNTDDSTFVDAGAGAVSFWTDKNLGIVLDAANTGQRPVTGTRSFAGTTLNAFDCNTDRMQNNTDANFYNVTSGTTNDFFEAYLVQPDNPAGAAQQLFMNSLNSTPNTRARVSMETSGTAVSAGFGSGTYVTGAYAWDTSPHLVAFRVTGTLCECWIDGVLIGTATLTKASSVRRGFMGRADNATSPFDGLFGKVVGGPVALSNANINTIMNGYVSQYTGAGLATWAI